MEYSEFCVFWLRCVESNPAFIGLWFTGLMTSSGGIPVNLTIVQTGYTSATMIAAAKAAVQSGEFDFYFGPPSSVRDPVMCLSSPHHSPVLINRVHACKYLSHGRLRSQLS